MNEALAELQTYRRMAGQVKVPLTSAQGLPADQKSEKEIAATVEAMERRARAAAERLEGGLRIIPGRVRRAMERRDEDLARGGQVATPEPAGAVFRGCPWCGSPIRWFQVDSSEVPDCAEHGVLDFWLVIRKARPVGFACPLGGTLWGRL